MAMSTQDAQFLSYLNHQIRYNNCFHLSALAILLYDHILTFHNEMSLIWYSRWSSIKILFLLTRYLPYVTSVLSIFNQFVTGRSEMACRFTWYGALWVMMAAANAAEITLAMRTWALWYRSRGVGLFLVILCLLCPAMEIYSSINFTHGLQFLNAPYPSFRGCFVYDSKKNLYATFVPFMVEEFVILVLVVIRAYPVYKAERYNKLSRVIYRDGIFFYIYILICSISNVIIIKSLPQDLSSIMIPMEVSLYSVLTARIVLNIREVSSLSDGGEGETELRSMQFNTIRFREFDDHEADHEPSE